MDFGLTDSGSVSDFGSLSLALYSVSSFVFYAMIFHYTHPFTSKLKTEYKYIGIQCPLSAWDRRKEKEIDWKKRKLNFFHFVQMLKKMKSDKLNGRVLEAWWVMGHIYAPRYKYTNTIQNEKMKESASLYKDQQKIMFLIISLFKPLFFHHFLDRAFSIFFGPCYIWMYFVGWWCCVRVTKTYAHCEGNRM